jgi:hypothetical protein
MIRDNDIRIARAGNPKADHEFESLPLQQRVSANRSSQRSSSPPFLLDLLRVLLLVNYRLPAEMCLSRQCVPRPKCAFFPFLGCTDSGSHFCITKHIDTGPTPGITDKSVRPCARWHPPNPWPARRKPADEASAHLALSKDGCRRNYVLTALPTMRTPLSGGALYRMTSNCWLYNQWLRCTIELST